MDPLTLQTIAECAGGTLKHGDPARTVAGLSTDTRTINPSELFVALRGESFDGHTFVEELSRQRMLGAIVDAQFRSNAELPHPFVLVEVADTLQAYQQVAARYRETLAAKVVAITGSNGKTSTKDLTAAVLGSRHRVHKTQGNFNNHVGLPRTLLEASGQDGFLVLEIGMNHPGEIAPLARIAAPDVAIVTNVGTAHIEYMKTRAAIAEEKGALLASLGLEGHAIIPAEDEFADALARRTRASKVMVGFTAGDLRAENLRVTPEGTRFDLVELGARSECLLPVPGRHMVLNGLLAIATGRVFGFSLDECAASLTAARLTKGRLERKTVAALQILDDTYNANPDSMVAALQTLSQLPVEGRRIAVLGKMGELGTESPAGHRHVGQAAADLHVDHLIVVGAEAEEIARGARDAGLGPVLTVPTVREATAWLAEFATPADLILIKGSRSAGMERVHAALETSAVPAMH